MFVLKCYVDVELALPYNRDVFLVYLKLVSLFPPDMFPNVFITGFRRCYFLNNCIIWHSKFDKPLLSCIFIQKI